MIKEAEIYQAFLNWLDIGRKIYLKYKESKIKPPIVLVDICCGPKKSKNQKRRKL